MNIYNVHAAKTQLSKLIEQAIAGEEVVIARNNEPVVKLVPVLSRPKRKRGLLRGQVVIHDSFFDPITAEDLRNWGME